MKETVLKVEGLQVALKFGEAFKTVVRGVDFSVDKGEILGILGESGSGKSVTVKSMLGLIPENIMRRRGYVSFENEDLLTLDNEAMQSIRGRRIGFVFQNSNSAMNNFMSIEKHFKEAFKVHKLSYDRDHVINLLSEVGIEDPKMFMQMYPHQLSGGLSQRAGIALALCHQPELIIADEPTSAIDASLRARILELFRHINEKFGTAIILITHDFDVALNYCDKVAIMYGGIFFEYGATSDVLKNPFTPYTASLKACAESLYNRDEVLFQLEGYPPSPVTFRHNCPFAPRCDIQLSKCHDKMPSRMQVGQRIFRCWNPVGGVRLKEDSDE